MKAKSRLRLGALCLIVCLVAPSGCAYTNRGKSESFFDSQFDKSQLQVNRVAIIPNRLPLVMKEPDVWRKKNWELIAALFRQHGYEVVDYDTSNRVFNSANLPIEDTGSSEEKFATAASQLNADILLMPYYSTNFTGNSVLAYSEMDYSALVSLQIYSTRENRFIFRADGTANSGYRAYSGLLSTASSLVSGAGSLIAGGGSGSSNNGAGSVVSIVILGISVVGLIFTIGDLANGLTPADEWWKRAFTEAVGASLEPFFSVYPKPAPVVAPIDPPPAVAPTAAPNPAQPPAQPPVQPTAQPTPADPNASPAEESLEDRLKKLKYNEP